MKTVAQSLGKLFGSCQREKVVCLVEGMKWINFDDIKIKFKPFSEPLS